MPKKRTHVEALLFDLGGVIVNIDFGRAFAAVYCSCELGMRKPAPEAFLGVAERMGVAPARIAFFDDTQENVRGAREAGLIAFQVSSIEQVRRALNDELQLGVI